MTIVCYCDAETLLDAGRNVTYPTLRNVVETRVAHMRAVGTLDMTVLGIIFPSATEAELVATLGWSPLIDPDGRRYGEPGFRPPFDYAYRVAADWHVAIQTVGNGGFAYELVIHGGADGALVRLCEEAAAQ